MPVGKHQSLDPLAGAAAAPPISISELQIRIGGQLIHDGLDLTVERGEILGVVGGSGSGKSVLLRSIIGLVPPARGSVQVFGCDIYSAGEAAFNAVKHRWGVLFQANALFSNLTVLENIEVPLREIAGLKGGLLTEIAQLKAFMSGLPKEDFGKLPNQLSGGEQKRAGIARAIALDPELLLLDEATSGLDPIMADRIDVLIRSLASTLGLTVLLVTHDIDTLYTICDRVAVLVERKFAAVAPIRELERSSHTWIRHYLTSRKRSYQTG